MKLKKNAQKTNNQKKHKNKKKSGDPDVPECLPTIYSFNKPGAAHLSSAATKCAIGQLLQKMEFHVVANQQKQMMFRQVLKCLSNTMEQRKKDYLYNIVLMQYVIFCILARYQSKMMFNAQKFGISWFRLWGTK